jgi:opacity protein-like surface antigen
MFDGVSINWLFNIPDTIIYTGAFMKNYGRTLFIIILILICTANSVFSQNLKNMQANLDIFADSIAKSLPLNSTIGNNWSDAYIGQITDKPPHFGIGVSAGFTTVDYIAVKDMLGSFNIIAPFYENESISNMGLPLPGYTADIRVGGVKFPFDFGIKAGFLPQEFLGKMITEYNVNFKYMLIGADIRYSILKENKILPVRFSAGLGFNFLDGGINSVLPKDLSFSFDDPDKEGTSYTLTPTEAQADLVWRTMNAELKAQASFPFKFVTPYVGAGVSYAWSQAGYKVTASKLEIDTGSIDAVEKLLKDKYNLTGISGTGFETVKTINGISARVFGGASVNLAYFRIDVTGMYEFLSGSFGATVGLRFQL